MDITLHGDGTVTYWSVYNQVWVNRASDIPDDELTAMDSKERKLVMKHLNIHQYREDDGIMTRDPISWEDLGDGGREWFRAWMAENPENNTSEVLAAELSTIWPESDEQELLEFLRREVECLLKSKDSEIV